MQVKRSLLKRVERLERDPRWRAPPPPSAEDQLLWKKAQELLRRIDPNDARSIGEDLGPARGLHQPSQWSGVTMTFMSRVLDHIQEGTPLAFPADVAEVYRENPDAKENDSCRTCRYKLPSRYFQVCPVCGGPLSSANRSAARVSRPPVPVVCASDAEPTG